MVVQGPIRKLLTTGLLLFLVAPTVAEAQSGGGGGQTERDYLRAVADFFNVSEQEAFVLSQWGLSPEEIPVVLFLAGRAGVSPDVVVSQRQRNRPWLDVAQGFSVHAGDFYVMFEGSAGSLADAFARFSSVPASSWDEVQLSDVEVVHLVNVRFMARVLGVSPPDVISAMDDVGPVGAFRRLVMRTLGR